MNKSQALTRAIASLRRDMERNKSVANLGEYGAPALVKLAARERRLNRIAIGMIYDMIIECKKP